MHNNKEEYLTLDETKKLVEYLALHTGFPKPLDKVDVGLYYDLTRHIPKSIIKDKMKAYVLLGKNFPTPFEWGKFIGVVTKHGDELEEEGAWSILAELRKASASGDNQKLSDLAQTVLREHGTSFYDFKYSDKARDKITVKSILLSLRATTKEHSETEVDLLPKKEDPIPEYVTEYDHPSGKKLYCYPQGVGPLYKPKEKRVSRLGGIKYQK